LNIARSETINLVLPVWERNLLHNLMQMLS